MKQQVSPIVAVIAVVVVVGVIFLGWLKFSGGGAGSLEGQKPPGMPPDVAAEFQRRSMAVTGPKPGSTPANVNTGPAGSPFPMAPRH